MSVSRLFSIHQATAATLSMESTPLPHLMLPGRSLFTSTLYGMYFNGASRITVGTLTPSSISPYSFTISVWMFIDPNYHSSNQELFRSSDSKFTVELTPSLSQIKVV